MIKTPYPLVNIKRSVFKAVVESFLRTEDNNSLKSSCLRLYMLQNRATTAFKAVVQLSYELLTCVSVGFYYNQTICSSSWFVKGIIT